MNQCIVYDCKNHKGGGSFIGDLCSPCYQYITENKINNSQIFRNGLKNHIIRKQVQLIEKIDKAMTEAFEDDQ